jgi:hypothetical protein
MLKSKAERGSPELCGAMALTAMKALSSETPDTGRGQEAANKSISASAQEHGPQPRAHSQIDTMTSTHYSFRSPHNCFTFQIQGNNRILGLMTIFIFIPMWS